ncbi:MAG: DUF2235 domain-containing protein [Oligoflexales bacterium]|nr:DUF2235 domain-containing protein [Oligoflexales bacterium]
MNKRLVICADGTWNKPNMTSGGKFCPTNVVKTAAAVLPQDNSGMAQVVYYHEGVGSSGGLWDRISGGAIGAGLSQNIKEIYLFLCTNYSPGDEIFLFGFSRGAYTVRSLAGMINNCGMLKRENMSWYEEAYRLYRNRDPDTRPSSDFARIFRHDYSWQDCRIRFVGVWDTVGSLGIPIPMFQFWNKEHFQFHDVELGSHIERAYQALAIDERRKPFLPAVWSKQKDAGENQVLEQAWFAGVHCNVGGGLEGCGLSDCALHWLWDRAQSAGLALDQDQKLHENAGEKIEDSMTLLYRILGIGKRKLGTSFPQKNEGIHHTVLERCNKVGSYKPGNLSEFLAGNPNPAVLQP